jgi:hypothetical protein
MNLSRTRMCALVLLCLALPLRFVQAQATAAATMAAGPFSYDVSKEVTLNGTVSSVLTTSTRGMVPGSHLLLSTPSGPVDASLGTFGLRGKGALSVEAGQQVEVTGVMKTLKGGGPVFLARTVRVGKQVYAIRNEHGVPVSPQSRDRASRKSMPNGETI